MFRHTLLQDFQGVSDHFGTLCIKGLAISLGYTVKRPVNSREKELIDIVEVQDIAHKVGYCVSN